MKTGCGSCVARTPGDSPNSLVKVVVPHLPVESTNTQRVRKHTVLASRVARCDFPGRSGMKAEVLRILRQMRLEEPKVKVGFVIGQSVRIVDGPFQDFVGAVDEINVEKGKVKVLVSFFGRETPVELDFLQAERET